MDNKRVDAFTPKSAVNLAIENDKELWELFKKPNKDSAEKLKTIQSINRKHVKDVERKGGTGRVGLGKDFTDEMIGSYRIPLGIPELDKFLGGGFPTMSFSISGGESVGKTTLMLLLAAGLQRDNFVVGFIDAEHTLDKEWAISLGVDWDKLALNQEEVFEDQLNWAIDILREGACDIMILDSVDSTLPRGEKETKKNVSKDMDDSTIGLKARIMSKFYPQILHPLKVNQIGFGLITQLRTTGIGSNYVREEATGGNARKFYDTLHLTMRRGSKSEAPKDPADDTKAVGYMLHITCSKSKVSGIREGDKISIPFFFEKGFDPDWSYLQLAYDAGIIEQKSVGSTIYHHSQGVDETLKGSKPLKILQLMKEQGHMDDLIMQVTGEISED